MSTGLAQEKGLEAEKSGPEKSQEVLVVDEKDILVVTEGARLVTLCAGLVMPSHGNTTLKSWPR